MDMNETGPVPPPALPAHATLLIDGEWRPAASGRSFTAYDPSTGGELTELAEGDAGDVDAAVAAARRALSGEWSRWKPYDRQKALLKLADLVETNFEEFARLDSLDMGAPIARTRANRQRALGMIRYYAGQATLLHGDSFESSLPGEFVTYTERGPVGVVGAIIPWNGPLNASIWKLGPVLATGCTVVLKPAEQASLTALRLGTLCAEAGIPPGVVNIVTGHGRTAGAALAQHPGVDKIAFTGSCETGRSIVHASAGNLKRLSLELGGKSPDIVFADADLDLAVPGAAMGIFGNSGQICSAGSRLFVERKIYREFTARVAEFARSLRIGAGLDPQTQIGPLVSAEQLARVSGYIEAGRREGAQASGGERRGEGGYFIEPTVFTDVEDGMTIAREEIFGPVVAAIPFDNVDEMIARANATEYGLGGGIWTRDLQRAHYVIRRLRAGIVWVNCYNMLDPAIPFGGVKMSGYGRESGRQHVDEYLSTKSVVIRVG